MFGLAMQHSALAGKVGFNGLFPPAYAAIINGFAAADRIYLDATNGDDVSGDGSFNAPYATIDHTKSQLSSGKCLVIYPGNYSITTGDLDAYGERMFTSQDFDGVVTVGVPGQVVIDEAINNAKRDNHIFGTTDITTKFYGLHIKRDNNGRSTTFHVALINKRWQSAARGEAHNCIIQEVNANGRASISYNNSGTSDFTLKNCLLDIATWLSPHEIGETGITIENCATTSVENYGTTATEIANVDEVTVDGTYAITDPTGVNNTNGVYSGTYAWP